MIAEVEKYIFCLWTLASMRHAVEHYNGISLGLGYDLSAKNLNEKKTEILWTLQYWIRLSKCVFLDIPNTTAILYRPLRTTAKPFSFIHFKSRQPYEKQEMWRRYRLARKYFGKKTIIILLTCMTSTLAALWNITNTNLCRTTAAI